jgi:hypothetical protein
MVAVRRGKSSLPAKRWDEGWKDAKDLTFGTRREIHEEGGFSLSAYSS